MLGLGLGLPKIGNKVIKIIKQFKSYWSKNNTFWNNENTNWEQI